MRTSGSWQGGWPTNFSGLASRVTLETMLEDFDPRLLSTARTISESAGSLPWT